MSAVAAPPLPVPVPPQRVPHPPASVPAPYPLRWTRAEVIRLHEEGYFTGRSIILVRGELIVMPKMAEPHALGIYLTTDAVKSAFGRGYYVRSQVPLALAADTDPLPDVAVVAGSPRDHQDTPSTALLVVEVAVSTLFYDVTTKAELYATAGVADYWVLDVDAKKLLVFRDPGPVPDGGSAYRSRQEFGPGEAVAPLAAPASPVAVADLLP